ncbi:TrkA family potassium uptake protein [Christensenella sp. MSJ-20]|uniref:potassium channel family protein n=1 Tax=Christensenella sp. MSJ-20 TaxID=2841518 RepID=UPI000D7ABFE0|nr:MAG: potassium transporter Trk [Bacillota bacterium]QWT54514.1 TrkA family potassium uptake protein [Christensenella sp. MSJ-20]
MKQIAVLGLGRFGESLAMALMAMGNQVLGIDIDEDKVSAVEEELTHVAIADMTDANSLRSLGLSNLDVAVVCTGDIQTSIMATVLLKDLGVQKVVSKAKNVLHEKILCKVGADQVVFPERDMGVRLAHGIADTNVIEFIELSSVYSLAEVFILPEWKGKTLMDADIRVNYGLNVVAIRRQGDIIVSPRASEVMQEGDVMVVIGKNADISNLDRHRKK